MQIPGQAVVVQLWEDVDMHVHSTVAQLETNDVLRVAVSVHGARAFVGAGKGFRRIGIDQWQSSAQRAREIRRE